MSEGGREAGNAYGCPVVGRERQGEWSGKGRLERGREAGRNGGRACVRVRVLTKVPLRPCRPHIHPAQHSLVSLFDVNLGCTHGQPQLLIVACVTQVVQLPACV